VVDGERPLRFSSYDFEFSSRKLDSVIIPNFYLVENFLKAFLKGKNQTTI